jgi:hypothetical protein
MNEAERSSGYNLLLLCLIRAYLSILIPTESSVNPSAQMWVPLWTAACAVLTLTCYHNTVEVMSHLRGRGRRQLIPLLGWRSHRRDGSTPSASRVRHHHAQAPSYPTPILPRARHRGWPVIIAKTSSPRMGRNFQA